MPRPKARRTKAAYMQARVEDSDKEVLQRYADKLGITLSELLRMTIKNLADIARGKPPQGSSSQ